MFQLRCISKFPISQQAVHKELEGKKGRQDFNQNFWELIRNYIGWYSSSSSPGSKQKAMLSGARLLIVPVTPNSVMQFFYSCNFTISQSVCHLPHLKFATNVWNPLLDSTLRLGSQPFPQILDFDPRVFQRQTLQLTSIQP